MNMSNEELKQAIAHLETVLVREEASLEQTEIRKRELRTQLAGKIEENMRIRSHIDATLQDIMRRCGRNAVIVGAISKKSAKMQHDLEKLEASENFMEKVHSEHKIKVTQMLKEYSIEAVEDRVKKQKIENEALKLQVEERKAAFDKQKERESLIKMNRKAMLERYKNQQLELYQKIHEVKLDILKASLEQQLL